MTLPSYAKRKSPRKKDFDYTSEGSYFITICTRNHEPFLGRVVGGNMLLSPEGEVVQAYWEKLRSHYEDIELDEFVVMPNHVHGILFINGREGHRPSPTKSVSLFQVIRSFKTFSAIEINKSKTDKVKSFWQRSYYDRIIRSERELNSIRGYIMNNPLQWNLDYTAPDFIQAILNRPTNS